MERNCGGMGIVFFGFYIQERIEKYEKIRKPLSI